MIRKAIESSGGRRFVMAMGAGVTTAILQWFGKLDPAGSTFAVVIIATVGTYIAANTTQKVKGPTDVAT